MSSKSLLAFKNTNAFRSSGNRQARRRLHIFPASEKTRSADSAYVAGMARYLHASTAREQNFASLACQQCNGSAV